MERMSMIAPPRASATSVTSHNGLGLSPQPNRDHDTVETLVTTCLCAGLLAALTARLSYASALVLSPTSSAALDTMELPMWGKVAVAAAALLICASGGAALLRGAGRQAGRFAFWTFAAMQIWMLWHAYMGFNDGFAMYELFTPKGPLTWLTMLCIFPAVAFARWRHISAVIWICAFVASLHALVAFTAIGLSDRMHMLRYLLVPAQILAVTCPWTLYSSLQGSTIQRLAGSVPAFAFLMVAVLTRTRSWTFLALLYFALVPIVEWRIAQNKAHLVSPLRMFGAVALGFVLAVVVLFRFAGALDSAYGMLYERLLDDTRTVQYQEFFGSGMGGTLLLGEGPRGTWMFLGREYAYLEGGFLTMAFTGGIPLVFCYLSLVTWPGLKVVRLRHDPAMLACAAGVLVWSLAQCGLGIFLAASTTLTHYVVLLYAGRCLGAIGASPTPKAISGASGVTRRGAQRIPSRERVVFGP